MHGMDKIATIASVCVVLVLVTMSLRVTAAADESIYIRSKPIHRLIPANVLRDFPGVCFGHTQCSLHAVNRTWSLYPLCGFSTCVYDKQFGEQLLELVQDCQTPKQGFDKDCPVAHDRFNETAVYPECCPVYKCKSGVKLEFLEPVTVAPAVIEEVPMTTPETSSK